MAAILRLAELRVQLEEDGYRALRYAAHGWGAEKQKREFGGSFESHQRLLRRALYHAAMAYGVEIPESCRIGAEIEADNLRQLQNFLSKK